MVLPPRTPYWSNGKDVVLATLLPFTAACSDNETLFRLTLRFDNLPNEVKWVIKRGVLDWNENAETVIERDFGYYNNKIKSKEKACLERNENYVFRIFDQGGDGICCSNGSGKYTIVIQDPYTKKRRNGKFGAYQDFAFSTGYLKDAAPPGFAVGGVLHGYNPEWKIGEYKDVAAREFNALTSTIFMGLNGFGEEWFTYAPFNEVVDFATTRDMLVHGHALVFPAANTPYWESNPGADVEDTLRQFITDTVQVRKGDVFVWDVVNEVFGYPGWDGNTVDEYGLRTDYKEYQALGRDYIRKSFEFARDADPDAVLILNEANAEELDDRSDFIFDYLKGLKDAGVPIDGIGFQMHVFERKNVESVRANFQRFQDEGFQIFITEMDVMTKGYSSPDTTPTPWQLKKQAAIYKEIAEVAVELPAVKSLLLWDFADDRSWMHPSSFQLGNKPVGTYFFPTPWADGGVDGKPMVKKDIVYDSIREGLSSGGTPSPTRAPTPNPTPAPIPPTDDGGCFDDPSFAMWGNESKDCDWVGQRKVKRCSKSFEGKPVSDWCPVTCNSCDGCFDDPSFAMWGNESNDCDWVGQRKVKRCSKSFEGKPVSDWCPVTCNSCNNSGPTPAPTPDNNSGTYKRISCQFNPPNGYLARGSYYDSIVDSWLPSTDLDLVPLSSTTEGWVSMHWKLLDAGSGMYRIVCGWGEDTGYLTRNGSYDSNTDSWLPDSTLSLYTLEEGWYSQLWILEYTDGNFFYLINQWGDDTGYLTSLGTSVAFSSETGSSNQYWTLSEI